MGISNTRASNTSSPKKSDTKTKDTKHKRRVVESSDDDDDDYESSEYESSDDEDEDDDEDYETVSESEDSEETENDDTSESDKSTKRKKTTKTTKKSSAATKKEANKKTSKKEVSKKVAKKEKSKTTGKNADNKKSHKKKRSVEEEDSSSDDDDASAEEDDESASDDSDDEDYDDEEDEKHQSIILAIDALGGGVFHNDEYDYEEMIKQDKHEQCDSDDEMTFMKELYVALSGEKSKPTKPKEKDNNDKTKNKDDKSKPSKSSSKNDAASKKGKTKKNKSELSDETDAESEDAASSPEKSVDDQYKELSQLKKELSEQLAQKPNNKILQNAIEECKQSISELVRKERKKNTESYYKLVHKDAEKKRNTNEMSYFKKKLSHKEQMKVMADLKEINAISNTDKPYRLQLLESNIPAKFKAVVLQKLNVLKMMDPNDSEYYKLKNWVDGFMRVPYGIYKNLNVTLNDGVDTCHEFIVNAKKTLDDCVYGLDDAKMQILQMVGQWIANPSAMGTAIAIKGPMGTGKTTLVKEGISKILGREFAFIALGGTGDASFLEGHSYTYEGSSWGKVVSILMDSKCMNPVIYFDELDKLSDTPKGEEIAGILTHMTDTTQNNQYHDKYFSEVDFDLSKCLFIFSYNDESKVNPILRDRMYRIQTKGYDHKEKMIIARKHLLPKIREQVNFKEDDVIIPDDALEYVIGTNFCKDEQGVRNLKRCLEIIHTKLNLVRLVKSDAGLFSKDFKVDIQFPVTVTKQLIDGLVKKEDPMSQSMLAMYV
jgi:ATP-dependent Lon protease